MSLARPSLRILVGIAVAGFAISICAFAARAWLQSRAERALVIDAPAGIDESAFVSIEGVEQWVWMRGRDRTNPVLLIVHGGPGSATSPIAHELVAYERDYVLVHWDQPGAGRTFARAGGRLLPALTIDRIVRDGLGVVEHVRARLGAPKVILLGVSWGSVVGVRMARARPELFAAYVGTGQIVNMRRGEELAYARVLAQARERGETRAIEDLERIGPPPYDTQAELGVQRGWASRFEGVGDLRWRALRNLLLAPRSTLADALAGLNGFVASQDRFFGTRMDGPLLEVDLATEGTAFDLPVIFVQGTDDGFTPAELSRAYHERIVAPEKVFVPLPGAGHFALVTHRDAFLAALNASVRPLLARRP